MPEPDDYDPKPIEEYFPIEQVNKIADKESKAKRYYRPVYTMHKWWARRLGSVFRTILLYSLADENMKVLDDDTLQKPKEWDGDPENLWDFYLEDVYFEDKTVLDPFMGGGTTIVEALRMGANVIGKDINPVAWFTTKKEVEPVDLDELDEAYRELEQEVAPEINKHYKTTCPECGETADAMYYFWVKELDCRNCGHTTPLFKDYRVAKSRSNNVEHKSKAICSNCGETYEPGEKCPHCGEEFDHGDYYHVHCPECGEIFQSPDYRSENTCPHCGNEFNPYDDGNATGKYFTCDKCGQKNEVIETIQEQGKPEERLWGVEYYCPHCDMKGYKPAKEEDVKLYEEAAEEYEKKKDELPIPQQEIPEGVKTRELTNHGYDKFKDMFNKRQLLGLSTLLKGIKDIDNNKVMESMLIPFSKSIETNNTFCMYRKGGNVLENAFSLHAYHPPTTPLENHPFGVEYGARTFKLYFQNLKDGYNFCLTPEERYIATDGSTGKEKMDLPVQKKGVDRILCGDSASINLKDNSIDAVITDPPYFDNVMYSELADFFYVWLREALKNQYPFFEAELTPKRGEVITNSVQDKDENDFTEGLTRVLSESAEKMKQDGIMVFTFHHEDPYAWSSVLNAILNSGLFVSSVYPINSEMETSPHIQNKSTIEYDMIIVSRKRKEKPEEKSWTALQDNIYFQAKDAIQDLENRSAKLSQGDKFVVAMGKCLEEYSKYYPNVVQDGKEVAVQTALEDIREIVDTQMMSGKFDELSEDMDLPSAAYLSFIAGRGGTIEYSSLNKELQQRSMSIQDLADWGYVKKDSGEVKDLPVKEKAKNIDRKEEEEIAAIDRAFYLKYLRDIDELAQKGKVEKWGNEKAVKALEELGDIMEEDTYFELANYVKKRMAGTVIGTEGEQEEVSEEEWKGFFEE